MVSRGIEVEADAEVQTHRLSAGGVEGPEVVYIVAAVELAVVDGMSVSAVDVAGRAVAVAVGKETVAQDEVVGHVNLNYY